MVWDPLRKKEVASTPEEAVRQWFIGILKEAAGVPEHMMMSEVALEYGAGNKRYRADIVVYRRDLKPVIIVECKRPETQLSEKVLEQALRYSMVLEAEYHIITNGKKTYLAKKENGAVRMLPELPKYDDICRQ